MKNKLAKDIEESIEERQEELNKEEISFAKTISTGSTLLDLAISGGRTRYGGIPAGIIVEIFGPSSSGKSSIISEICAYAQSRNGEARILDPEARLDQEYSKIYGVSISKENYFRPDTITDMFELLYNWKPTKEGICVFAGDSLAALSTKMEMEDGDAYGMRRAKEFSEGLRKAARLIANNQWICVFTNQERDSPTGNPVTPGGKAIPYYSSVRIRVSKPVTNWKITKTATINGKKVEKVIGIKSKCQIKKSSVDDPYREVPISIVFGVGIDDVRSNLEYLKEYSGWTKYVFNDKEIGTIDKAIEYVEENNLEENVKEQVIDLWNHIQDSMKINRKIKERK